MMLKIASFRISAGWVGLLIITACSSDLEINSGHPAVPVIWCAMNPYDSVQYVRVQKTFIINHKEDWTNLNPGPPIPISTTPTVCSLPIFGMNGPVCNLTGKHWIHYATDILQGDEIQELVTSLLTIPGLNGQPFLSDIHFGRVFWISPDPPPKSGALFPQFIKTNPK